MPWPRARQETHNTAGDGRRAGDRGVDALLFEPLTLEALAFRAGGRLMPRASAAAQCRAGAALKLATPS
jgi:hypothetical protein